MPYKISKTDQHRMQDGYKYLLDSNIWIEILTSRNKDSARHKKYKKFFGQVVANENVKIVLPSLLISEVLNRILREVYMPKYAYKKDIEKGKSIPSEYYKNTYRSTTNYKDSYCTLCDDIIGYEKSIEFINDGFAATISHTDILSNPPVSLDFNDFYYFTLAKLNNYFIVTDDKDFWVEDVQIITESPTLISKKNNNNYQNAIKKQN